MLNRCEEFEYTKTEAKVSEKTKFNVNLSHITIENIATKVDAWTDFMMFFSYFLKFYIVIFHVQNVSFRMDLAFNSSLTFNKCLNNKEIQLMQWQHFFGTK